MPLGDGRSVAAALVEQLLVVSRTAQSRKPVAAGGECVGIPPSFHGLPWQDVVLHAKIERRTTTRGVWLESQCQAQGFAQGICALRYLISQAKS